MAATEADLGELAAQIVADERRELRLDGMPAEVRDTFGDYAAAVADVIGAGRQLERDLAELDAKRDLVPAAGAARLRGEAVADADNRAQAADRRAERALAQLRDSLTAMALPVLDPAREQLARDELRVALAGADDPAELLSRCATLGATGSREAAAALLSSYGATLLVARGLTGRDFEQALSLARDGAAETAASRGETERERTAGAALDRIGSLAAARASARAYLDTIGR